MRSLSRDIKITLIIKFSLLFILWLICFKDVAKPKISTQQWLLGSQRLVNTTQSSNDAAPFRLNK